MKRRTTVAVALICLVAGSATAGDWLLTAGVTWDLGLRVGMEYRPVPELAIGGSVGSTLFSLEGAFALTFDALVTYFFGPPDRPLKVGVSAGIPTGYLILTEGLPFMISFGGSVQLGYAISERLEAFLRVGEGFPLFVEAAAISVAPPAFPLGLWPDLMLGGRLRLNPGT